MFGMGVKRLLDSGTELDVVGSGMELAESVERIKELQPDVLILDKDRWPGELPAELVGLLEQGSGIKIVGLSLQDNTICSYRKEMRVVKAVEDLMEAIR